MSIARRIVTFILIWAAMLSTRSIAAQREVGPDQSGVYGRGPGVVMPRVLQSVEASYTEEARKRKIKGQAMLQVIVNADGTIRSVRLTKSIAEAYSSPQDKAAAQSLDQQAIEAVRQYVFAPGTYRDQPASTWVPIEVDFDIH